MSQEEIDWQARALAAEDEIKGLRSLIGDMRLSLFSTLAQGDKHLKKLGVDVNFLSDQSGLVALLATPVIDLELSVRAHSCLEDVNIKHIFQLVEKSQAWLLKNNFGRKSLNEIEEILADKNLSLGMVITLQERAAIDAHIAGFRWAI